MATLNLGCGTFNRKQGEIGIDIDVSCKPDVCGDISYLPFKDRSFDSIYAIHCLEHIQDIVRTMNECHRVLKHGGKFNIRVPLFRMVGSIADPTHKRYFIPETFRYFVKHGALPGLKNTFHQGEMSIADNSEILSQLTK